MPWQVGMYCYVLDTEPLFLFAIENIIMDTHSSSCGYCVREQGSQFNTDAAIIHFTLPLNMAFT